MWTYAVFLLVFWGGVLGEDFCDDGLVRACNSWFDNRPSFPETEEDVIELCPKILSHLKCVQDFVAKCGDETVLDGNHLPKFRVYLEDICKEDSTLRSDIVKELPCIKDALEEETSQCVEISKKPVINYLKENYPYIEDSSYGMMYYCYVLTTELACQAAAFDEKCGSRAKDILLDARLRTGYLDNACEKEETDDLLKVVEGFQLESAQKEQISGILRAYRVFSYPEELEDAFSYSSTRIRREVLGRPPRVG